MREGRAIIEDGQEGDEQETSKPEPTWDGITRAETLSDWARDARVRIADRARAYDWPGLLHALAEHPDLINSTRPSGQSWYAPLHQAAHGEAPVEVVQRLLALGAWRTLRTAKGEQAIDIAKRRGHAHLLSLLSLLTPVLLRGPSSDTLRSLQEHFHAVIRGRADQLVRDQHLRLPELEILLELEEPKLWFAVPGMYGGFHFWLDEAHGSPVLVTESWCRVVEGSGQRHLISPHGSVLLNEGFV